MRKKLLIIAGAILLLFIITNPGIKRFKEFTGHSSYGGLRRTGNFIVFSVYKIESINEYYAGVFLNF